MTEQAKILVVDDEKLICMSLRNRLAKEGYEVLTAASGEEGLEAVRDESPDLILLDIKLPQADGIEVLKEVKAIDPAISVIMITAYGNVETAVTAIKLGASDYINKPFNMDEVAVIVKNVLETGRLKREVTKIRAELRERYGIENIVGNSESLKKALEVALKAADSDSTTVLIHGESGTGKEMVARAIHFHSSRAGAPFIELNCSSLPETLIESELFGYEKGAFTDAKGQRKGLFELGDGGSILLDEVGEMHPTTQAKLLRVIEGKTFKRLGGSRDISVDVRIIAVTNKDLASMVKEGSFREDLYYRLNVLPMVLPPLRDRGDDVVILTTHFISRFNHEFRKKVKGVSREVVHLFRQYSWPGNVRELRNLIERVMILEEVDIIEPIHLPPDLLRAGSERTEGLPVPICLPSGGLPLDEVERELIRQALHLSGGNQSKAAALLKIGRDALRYKMKKYGYLEPQ